MRLPGKSFEPKDLNEVRERAISNLKHKCSITRASKPGVSEEEIRYNIPETGRKTGWPRKAGWCI